MDRSRYELVKSADHHRHVLCYEGTFEKLPHWIRNQGPWQGGREGFVANLLPAHQRALEECGFMLITRSAIVLEVERQPDTPRDNRAFRDRYRPPWDIENGGNCYYVLSDSTVLAILHYRTEAEGRSDATLMKSEAAALARAIVSMPDDLLRGTAPATAVADARDARAALRMIREALELHCPPGTIKSEEYVEPPFTDEAEVLVAAILRLAGMAKVNPPGM
jgi:hypothetical protein